MQLKIDMPRPVHEELEQWKAVKFPVPKPDYSFSEPNKILQKEFYTYAKEDNFKDLFGKLEHVSSEEVLDIIFKHVAASGNSLLHVAASHGSEGVTQLLCHHFPLLITRKNFLGDNALHLAARAGRFDTIQILVNHVEIHHRTLELASLLRMKNNKGNTPLHDAASMGFLDVARLLFSLCPVAASQRNDEGNLPMHVACQKGHLEVVQELLEYWYDPMDFLINEKGQNILHVAAESGQMKIVDEILGNRDMKALIKGKDYDGNTPLHLAAMNGRSEIVRALRKVLKDLVEADDKTEFDINLNFDLTTLTTEELNRRVGNLLVVAVLVAGVTFAGAITVPGSCRDLNSGSSKNLMRAYIFFDMLAMNGSLIAAIILCQISLGRTSNVPISMEIATYFNFYSLFYMGLAFTFILAITVQERTGFFITIITVQASAYFWQILCSSRSILSSGKLVLSILRESPFKFMVLLMGGE